ncbi:MAG TPA: spore coat U domain-containing protein [Thermoanaerobaculia bacterium]|nr:spore coat U domain-containing protein [Thermoanaerobaculia bacterium]
MIRPATVALLTMSMMAAAGAVRADSIGTRMDVTATVVANCRLIVPALSFGTYDPLAAHATQPADASVDVTLNCTRNTPAALSFNFGLHSPSGGNRAMGGPGSADLRYQIYRDAARSEVWSQGTEALRLVAHGVGVPDQFTVFGRIPPAQEVDPGAYSDVLTATVDF